MRSLLKTGLIVLTLAAVPFAAQAGRPEGVAIGAGWATAIAGTSGAGGRQDVADYRHRRHHHCWINRHGYRHCSWG
jgi:hypothetical protein